MLERKKADHDGRGERQGKEVEKEVEVEKGSKGEEIIEKTGMAMSKKESKRMSARITSSSKLIFKLQKTTIGSVYFFSCSSFFQL